MRNLLQGSPLGVPVFHNAIKELRNLDIAWSRKETEIEDSKHISYVDIGTIRYERLTGAEHETTVVDVLSILPERSSGHIVRM